MDPADFAAHSLPKIEYTEKDTSHAYGRDRASLSEFYEEFTNYISGDCHAITVDDEIIYNSYEPKTIRETIQDGMIRQQLIANPHSLFINMFRNNKSGRVIVYMYGLTPWFVAVYYNHSHQLIYLEYYKSKAYEEAWEQA